MTGINRRALGLWSVVAVVSVFLLFHVLHALIDHALAVVLAGVGGVVVAAAGYGWKSGDPSPRGIALAGVLGGVLGLFVLHLLPLLG